MVCRLCVAAAALRGISFRYISAFGVFQGLCAHFGRPLHLCVSFCNVFHAFFPPHSVNELIAYGKVKDGWVDNCGKNEAGKLKRNCLGGLRGSAVKFEAF